MNVSPFQLRRYLTFSSNKKPKTRRLVFVPGRLRLCRYEGFVSCNRQLWCEHFTSAVSDALLWDLKVAAVIWTAAFTRDADKPVRWVNEVNHLKMNSNWRRHKNSWILNQRDSTVPFTACVEMWINHFVVTSKLLHEINAWAVNFRGQVLEKKMSYEMHSIMGRWMKEDEKCDEKPEPQSGSWCPSSDSVIHLHHAPGHHFLLLGWARISSAWCLFMCNTGNTSDINSRYCRDRRRNIKPTNIQMNFIYVWFMYVCMIINIIQVTSNHSWCSLSTTGHVNIM